MDGPSGSSVMSIVDRDGRCQTTLRHGRVSDDPRSMCVSWSSIQARPGGGIERRILQMLCCLCEGCDIVQSDHAPQAGVAQGIFNGDLIRAPSWTSGRAGRGTGREEVERQVRRDHSRDNTQVRMHG